MLTRKIIICFLFISIGINTKAQLNQKALFEQKVERYAKMKKNGITMGAIGGAATVIGILFINQADWEKQTTPTGVNYNTDDPSGTAGIVIAGVGVPLVITGIILGAIGNKKEKEYKSKLDNLSLKLKSTKEMTGVSLVYDF